MNPLAEGEGKCPHCGYQEGMPYSFAYLKPGTVLKDRYLMGRVIKKNSEGATYIGYDLTEDKKVLIREFMPVQIAERNEATMQVRPIAGSERQYKTALSDFVELSGMLDDRYVIVLIGLSSRQISALPENILGLPRTNSLEELVQAYSEADVFLNPSVEETFGMTAMEARCCGTEAVVYRDTACEEIVDQFGGIAVPKGAQHLYEAVKKLTEENA